MTLRKRSEAGAPAAAAMPERVCDRCLTPIPPGQDGCGACADQEGDGCLLCNDGSCTCCVDERRTATSMADKPDPVDPSSSPRDRFLSGGARGGALSTLAMVGHADHFAAANELVDEAWQGILQRPHLALFGGPPGVGKTTLAAHLIVALANPTGKPVDVLGYRVTPVPEGSFVVLVEEENGRRSIAKKLADSCDAYGLPVRETIDRIVTIPRSGFRVNSGSREHDGSPWYELRGRARDGLVGALFLDSWASTIRAESNSEEAQAEAAGWLRSFVELSGGPVVAVVHTRKGDPSSLDDIAGSHQRAAAADVILLVTAEKEGGAVLSSKITFAKLRDSEGEHPKPVSFSVARVEGHTRVALNGSARAEDMPAHERVFQCIQQGEKTRHQIRDALKMSGERVKQALDTLKAEKRMAWSKRTIGGRDTYFARAREVDPTAGLFKSAHTPPHEVQDDAF